MALTDAEMEELQAFRAAKTADDHRQRVRQAAERHVAKVKPDLVPIFLEALERRIKVGADGTPVDVAETINEMLARSPGFAAASDAQPTPGGGREPTPAAARLPPAATRPKDVRSAVAAALMAQAEAEAAAAGKGGQ
jgi:hypothetical protein